MAPREEKKFSLIQIEPDVPARARFKESTIPVHWFGQVIQVATLEDAVQRLNNGTNVDIVFFSYRFTNETLAPFIKKCKEAKGSEDAALIQIMKPNSENASLAQQMINGVDGFLFEPFSVEGLTEVAQITVRVKKQKAIDREKAAIKFVVSDLMKQIDRAAFLLTCEMEIGRTMAQLRHLSEVVRGFEGETAQLYFEVIVETFENAPPPNPALLKYKNYKGASTRVKKMMQEKLLRELDMQDAASATPRLI